MKSLDGQVAIVTGGAAGIGRAIAEVLAEEGATLVVADADRAAAEAAAVDLAASDRPALGCEVDVRDRAALDAMVETVGEAYGRIDIVAANAGIYPAGFLDEIQAEDWRRVMEINVLGAVQTVQASLSQMRSRQYGRIVLTSSITGPVTGIPGFAAYGASKAAMLGFMRSAALEVAADGVTVNAVLPGNVATPGMEAAGAQHESQMLAGIPLGRLADPREVGWAVRFLAAPEAGFITGQTLVVDGGQILPEAGE